MGMVMGEDTGMEMATGEDMGMDENMGKGSECGPPIQSERATRSTRPPHHPTWDCPRNR